MNNNITNIKNNLILLKEQLVNKKYRHFKGNIYYIRNLTIDSENLSIRVIYSNIEDPNIEYDRPYDMFFSKVSIPSLIKDNELESFETIDRFQLLS